MKNIAFVLMASLLAACTHIAPKGEARVGSEEDPRPWLRDQMGVKHMIDLHKEYERACSKPHEGTAFDELQQRDKILIAIWGLEADVNNGGFDQYYFNDSGDQAFFVVEALEIIGARNMAAIVRDANEKFGASGPARDRNSRQTQLVELTTSEEDLFDALDWRFYDYPDDISALLIAYIEGHPDSSEEHRP